MNLIHIESELKRLTEERQEKIKLHEDYQNKMNCDINELYRQREIYMQGVDCEKVKIAESLLEIRGLSNGRYDERCISSAIADVLVDCAHMRKEYFGAKNYEGFTYQACDCQYGMGPRHGHIVFSVGLKNPKEILTEEEKECCLYYLNAIRKKETREAIAGIKSA